MSEEQKVTLVPLRAVNILAKEVDEVRKNYPTFQIEMTEVLKDWIKRFNSPFIQNNSNVRDDNAKLLFCAKLKVGVIRNTPKIPEPKHTTILVRFTFNEKTVAVVPTEVKLNELDEEIIDVQLSIPRRSS